MSLVFTFNTFEGDKQTRRVILLPKLPRPLLSGLFAFVPGAAVILPCSDLELLREGLDLRIFLCDPVLKLPLREVVYVCLSNTADYHENRANFPR